MEKTLNSLNVSKTSEMLGVGNETSIVRELRTQKSVAHLKGPFFFFTGTNGDAHGEWAGSITQLRNQSSS